MPGPISRWILSRVLASGLAFEEESIGAYRGMRAKMLQSGSRGEQLESSLRHLLEEDEAHGRVLSDAATGKLSAQDLDLLYEAHPYTGFKTIQPLTGNELAQWSADLSAALEQEEKTWIFYGNLRRMSKIPAVKKAFEVLASMEKEHVDILRRLLGRGSP
ncbi:MAG: ferritin family protein [Spirochaetia bacterium]|jgi:rubrerythrin